MRQRGRRKRLLVQIDVRVIFEFNPLVVLAGRRRRCRLPRREGRGEVGIGSG
jgi:hypothetical protein